MLSCAKYTRLTLPRQGFWPGQPSFGSLRTKEKRSLLKERRLVKTHGDLCGDSFEAGSTRRRAPPCCCRRESGSHSVGESWALSSQGFLARKRFRQGKSPREVSSPDRKVGVRESSPQIPRPQTYPVPFSSKMTTHAFVTFTKLITAARTRSCLDHFIGE